LIFRNFRNHNKKRKKRISDLEQIAVRLAGAVLQTTENVNQLSEDMQELREPQKALNESQKELSDLQRETNDRLKAVMLMAEKYFSGENGKRKKK
jgi:hypothetical protein